MPKQSVVHAMLAVMSGRPVGDNEGQDRLPRREGRNRAAPASRGTACAELGGGGCGRLARQVGHEPDVDQRRDAQVCPIGSAARGRRSGPCGGGAVEIGCLPPLRGAVGGTNEDAMGQRRRCCSNRRRAIQPMEHPMPHPNDLSRSLVALDQDSTLIAIIEMSQSSWLVAGIIPGVERHPLKKLDPNENTLLQMLYRWRAEASRTGHTIMRIAVAFEAVRDGFWLARWLRARGIETHVIHPSSIAAWQRSRQSRRRTPSARTENARAWSGSAPASLIA